MPCTPEVLPPLPSAQALRSALPEMEEALGSRVCIVGGYVRDLLIGRPTSPDVDLVVEGANAADAARWLRSRWRRSEPVVEFERFGTAQVAFALPSGGRFAVEMVRARGEAYSPDSRKPTVRPGSLSEDVMRRDFTVNALLLDSRGRVLDPTGWGIADLRRSILRTPLDPELTFAEDPLRMLRAARFSAQLDFRLAGGIEAAMATAAGRISIVSQERVRDELLKLLLAPRPDPALGLLLRTGLLRWFLPEVADLAGVEQGGYHVGDVFIHTAMAVEVAAPSRLVRLAALFHDVGKPATAQPGPDGPTFHGHPQVGAELARQALRRLRLPGAEVEDVARLVELHIRPIQYRSEWSDSAVRRLWHDAGRLAPALLELARADTRASSYPTTAQIDELDRRMAELTSLHPAGLRSPLRGHDLKDRFQRPEGPWVGRALRVIEEALISGALPAEAPDAADRAWEILDRERPAWGPRPGERGWEGA